MKTKLQKNSIINPTTANHSQLFFSAIQSTPLIKEYQPITFTDPQTLTKVDVLFTHPMFRFNKPQRVSKKTGAQKPAGAYMAVYDPEPLGAGEYGAVYPVLGVWKSTNFGWIYKTKTDPLKERLVKTNAGLSQSRLRTSNGELRKSIGESYISEQHIGKWVPHMSYKYPVVTYQDSSFLLMRKQPGRSLETIIKQLHKDPNYLSITNKLRITVNLLNEVHNQIHGIIIPSNPNIQPPPIKQDIMIHSDIKPANILITNDYSVKYIDYGLAKRSSKQARGGTPVFLDPKVLEGNKLSTDILSDLYSLARTIAELWGDRSADIAVDKADVIVRNINNGLNGLLNKISGITQDEKDDIINAITAMIDYDESKRPSREEILNVFKPLLAARIELDRYLLRNTLARRVEELSIDEILDLLKSAHAYDFLKKFDSDPKLFETVVNKLSHRVLELNDPILSFINKHYFNFNNKAFLTLLLKDQELTAEHVKRIIKLGAPVDEMSLIYWMEWVSEYGQDLRWASICRELCKAIPNAHNILSSIEQKNPFKTVYCQHFLMNKDASTDDKSNVRLVRRHLEIIRNNNYYIYLIKHALNTQLLNTPLETAILASDLVNGSSQELLIVDDGYLNDILEKIRNLNIYINLAKKLVYFEGMPHRNTVLLSLHSLVQNIIQLNGFDWSSALIKNPKFESQLLFLHTFDNFYRRLKKHAPIEIFSTLSSELDNYCHSSHYSSSRVSQKLDYLVKGFEHLEKMNHLKEMMDKRLFKIPLNSLLEKNLTSLLRTASFKEAHPFYNSLKPYRRVYSKLLQLVNELNNDYTDFENHSKLCHGILQKLSSKLEQVLPKEDAKQYMTELSHKMKHNLEKSRLINRSDNPSFFSKYKAKKEGYVPLDSSDGEALKA